MSKRKNKCCKLPFKSHKPGCYYLTHDIYGMLKNPILSGAEGTFPNRVSWSVDPVAGDISKGLMVPAQPLQDASAEDVLYPPIFSYYQYWNFNGNWISKRGV